jgi:DNA repair protein RadD
MNAPFLLKPLSAAVRLRPYQREVIGGIYAAWASGSKNVLAVLPTGAGKTVCFSSVMSQHQGASVAIAHRQELIGQIAAALNKVGVRFRIIAPKPVRKLIIKAIQHSQGICHYDPTADVGVASVASIKNIHTSQQYAGDRAWANRITLWVNDEAHHLQADNIWGTVLGLFPADAKGLGVTATPIRGDGGGLGRTSDGVFDVMVEGPMLGDLMTMGYLTPYKVVCAPVSVDYSDVKVGAGGEYVNARLVAAEDASGLTGDIVKTYMLHTPGKLALAFVSSVKRAHELAEQFVANGIPAAAISGTTPDDERAELIGKLEKRELMVLCNVDVAGEGTDLPAVEVVIMGTKTASLSRFLQWAGRALRLVVDYTNYDDLTDAQRRQRIAESPKPYAWIIDHANNIITHGLPDKPHFWTLDGERKSSGDSDAIPLRPCTNPGLQLVNPAFKWDDLRKAGWTNELLLQNGHAVETGIPCAQPYEAFLRCCEFCGYMPESKGRRDPAQVEGDLELLDEETMAALRASYLEARQSIEQFRSEIASRTTNRMNGIHAGRAVNLHADRLAEFEALDEAMGRFGGVYKAKGESDTKIQRRFFATFGIDVLSAGALKRVDAEKLRGKIDDVLNRA